MDAFDFIPNLMFGVINSFYKGSVGSDTIVSLGHSRSDIDLLRKFIDYSTPDRI
jgi:hypothetical protein